MEKVKTIVNTIKDSFWTGKRSDTVYGIFHPDERLYVNNDMPYRLTFFVYNKSQFYANADTFTYLGGVMIDGSIQILDGINGYLQNPNTIIWNNGDIWSRVNDIPSAKENGYALRDKMDINESAWLFNKLNSTYKRSPTYDYDI